MTREAQIWLIVFLLGAAGLVWRMSTAPNGVGMVYVFAKQPMEEPPPGKPAKPLRYLETVRETPGAALSIERTIGVWFAAMMTLGVLSYLYRDNPFYKLVESIVVGVSAGYVFVVGYWEVLVDKLALKLAPALVHAWTKPLQPGESPDVRDWWALVPLVMGVLVFFRFVPKREWLATWPLAFVVGLTAGIKLIAVLEADFIGQIQKTMMPLLVFAVDQSGVLDWKKSLSASIKNTLLVLGVLASLTYFYFSVEHKGIIRQVARCGIWVLMITFGSSFAFTVMGRITLLTVRLEFLLGRWLGFIDVPR